MPSNPYFRVTTPVGATSRELPVSWLFWYEKIWPPPAVIGAEPFPITVELPIWMLRSQVALAAKANGRAQRALFETVQVIEREIAVQERANNEAKADMPPLSDLEAARRVAFVLEKGARELERRNGNPCQLRVRRSPLHGRADRVVFIKDSENVRIEELLFRAFWIF
jgi:hypothetical protein